jgi:hypothetical protein|uniref:Uncharacterized protein n=1 Tax=Picea sitchensis TaxID=3332 RepID=A9NPG2_PICSI|nr:unknown [Picea sitchensis]ABK22872.1 unknown [Picea sitchensis]ABK25517.1 unknown [Picea sitchensis]
MEMDPILSLSAEQDEWDADGFEIPTLKLKKSSLEKKESVANNFSLSTQKVITVNDQIYLGPHGAPPSQVKQQDLNATGKNQRVRQRLKEDDKKKLPQVMRIR